MNRIARYAAAGALAAVLGAVAAPAATAGGTAEEPRFNKAQIEYEERVQLTNRATTDWGTNKAFIEYQERVAMAGTEPNAPAPAEAGDTSTGMSASPWQLALSALAGVAIGGAAVAGARARRPKEPAADVEPEHREPAAV